MIPSASEQMNEDISNMGSKSSSIQITSTKLRMNSNEHESDQLSDEIDMEPFYNPNLDCRNNATIIVSSSSSASSCIAAKPSRDKNEIKQSEQENFHENVQKRDVFFSDASLIDKINLIEEHHHELKLKNIQNESLVELTLIDQEANKHNELEAQLLDKIEEVRSIESANFKREMDALNEQEMNPGSPIITLELPSENLLKAFNQPDSAKKSSIDVNKPNNDSMDTSSLHFSFESMTNSQKKPSQSIVIEDMMESDKEDNRPSDKRARTIRELFERQAVENPCEMANFKKVLFDKSAHQSQQSQTSAANSQPEQVVKFKEVTIVKTYNYVVKSVFKEIYDASNNKLLKSELQDRSTHKEVLTENKVTKFHSTSNASPSTLSSSSIPNSFSLVSFEPTMQPIQHDPIKKSTSLLAHDSSSPLVVNDKANSKENKKNESHKKKNAAEPVDKDERKNEPRDETLNNKETKTNKPSMRSNLKNKPKFKLGIRINKEVTSSSEEAEADDLVYDQRTSQWVKSNSTNRRVGKSTGIVTRSSKNSPLPVNAAKQRAEQQSNKRTRFNSPSFNQKIQPESKKQRKRITSSSQYFSFSDIRFKLTPEERRQDAMLKSKEAQEKKEEEPKQTVVRKPSLEKNVIVVEQEQTNRKSNEAVDATSNKTQLVTAQEIDLEPASVESNAIDRFMHEFSNNVANYINLSDLEEKNETNVAPSVASASTSYKELAERFKLKELSVRVNRLDESVFREYYHKYKQTNTNKVPTWSKENLFDYNVGDKVFVQRDEGYWLPAIVENKMLANVNNQALVLHQCKFVNTNVGKKRVSRSNEAFSDNQLIPYDLFQASDSLLVYDHKQKLYRNAMLEEYESVQNEKLDESVLSYVVSINSTKSRQTCPFQDIKLENSEVNKVLVRLALNQRKQTEKPGAFHLNHDHQYSSVKRNEQVRQDEDEMTAGDDGNSIITLSSTQSATSDLISRHAAKNALKTLRTRYMKNSLPLKLQTPNKKRNQTVRH